MSTQKTQFDPEAAAAFVTEHLHIPEPEIVPLSDGETSQAFFFETEEGPRVLRVSKLSTNGFLKDQLAHRFDSPAVPVPEVFEVGTLDNGLSFAVSERVSGKTLDKLDAEEIQALMPSIIATLDAIHAIPPMGEGFGSWDLQGQGRSKSWHEDLLEHHFELEDDDVRAADFYDNDLHTRLRDEIGPMLDRMPEERKMTHADFGFNNTLADGTKISGVIDWEHSEYGDFMRDIAWLDFWGEKHGFAEAFREHYEAQGTLPVDFDERLLCYKLLIGLGSLCFFARSRQEQAYLDTIGILERIER